MGRLIGRRSGVVTRESDGAAGAKLVLAAGLFQRGTLSVGVV